ncbi:MAG: RibD family protein [Planctomycetota bacterium]
MSPGKLLDELGTRGMTNVLIEGGGEVFGSFFDAGLVDRVLAFVSPVVIGGTEATAPVAGRGVQKLEEAPRIERCETLTVGPDTLIQGWSSDPLDWAP